MALRGREMRTGLRRSRPITSSNRLDVEDQDRLTADLSCVHSLAESSLPLSPVEELLPGSEVKITGEPLVGLQGTVIHDRLQ